MGAMRSPGTSMIIEDLVIPVPRLAEGVTDLQSRFQTHGYDDAIIFGHAKDGNLHFNFSACSIPSRRSCNWSGSSMMYLSCLETSMMALSKESTAPGVQ